MVRNADEAIKIAVAGEVYALLTTGVETGGRYVLVEASVPTSAASRLDFPFDFSEYEAFANDSTGR